MVVQRLDAIAFAQIVAGRKMRTIRGEDDHLDLIVLRGGIESIVELIEEVRVLRIPRRDAIQNDSRNMLGRSFIDDVIESFHGILLHSPCYFLAPNL